MKIKWDDIKNKSREIDKLIAEHVFGEKKLYNINYCCSCFNTSFTYEEAKNLIDKMLMEMPNEKRCAKLSYDNIIIDHGILKYSTKIADAWYIVDEINTLTAIMKYPKVNKYACTFEIRKGKEVFIYHAKENSLSLAICHVALLSANVVGR